MHPGRKVIALRRVVLSSAMLVLGMASASPGGGDKPATVPLAVAGGTLRIPPPAGMVVAPLPASRAREVLRLLPGLERAPGTFACFVPDSLLPAVRRRGSLGPGLAPLALVCPLRSDDVLRSPKPDSIEDQRTMEAFFGLDLSLVLWPLETDLEGVADLPVEMPGRSAVALQVIDLGNAGFGSVQAVPVSEGRPGAPAVRWELKAAAMVTAGDHEIYAEILERGRPSSGTVAALRRRFIEWVGDIAFENSAAAAGGSARRATRGTDPTGLEAPKRDDADCGERFPEAVLRVAPLYPRAARESGLTGEVLVTALIGKDGRVEEARIARSVPGLDESAMSTIRLWRFIPASSGGKPVAVWVRVPVRFSLD